MVRLHRLHDLLVGAELLEDAPSDLDVGALYLVIDRLADVVEEGAGLRDRDIRAELFGEHAGDVRHLDRVLEHVLPVARPEVEPAEDGENARVEVEHTDLVGGLLTLILDDGVHLLARLLDLVLDAGRLHAAVLDEPLERDLCHGAAYRVEAREEHSAGRVVDDDLNTCRALERLDVAALLADDLTLHVV